MGKANNNNNAGTLFPLPSGQIFFRILPSDVVGSLQMARFKQASLKKARTFVSFHSMVVC